MKSILALDGGGIRGVFTLEILLRIEMLMREHFGNPSMTLSDCFDFFAGTSTGGIIAGCLCWGMDVASIMDMYVRFGATMFTRVPWYRPIERMLISRYQAKPLSDMLKRIFSEDGQGNVPALLNSERLRKLLLVVVRNHSTGSSWPVTNNRHALYNDPTLFDCNALIPIWQLLRASTAAPVYFDPETIWLGDREHIFVDGSLTPYNNPALIAALMAVLPSYKLDWPTGPDKIRVISIGTLRFSSALPEGLRKLWIGYNAANVPPALIQGIAWEQDLLCRCLGSCLHGESLDSELGDLTGALPREPWFSYVRYNQSYAPAAAQKLLLKHPRLAKLDAIDTIPALRAIGREYAAQHVELKHLIGAE